MQHWWKSALALEGNYAPHYTTSATSVGFEADQIGVNSGSTTYWVYEFGNSFKFSGFSFIHCINGWFFFQNIEPQNSPSVLILLTFVRAMRFWCLMGRIEASRRPWAVALGSIIKKVAALVSLGFHNKRPYTLLLKQQVYFSCFWRLEVQDQSASLVSFWWGPPSWLVGGCLISVSSHGEMRKRERTSKLSGVPS